MRNLSTINRYCKNSDWKKAARRFQEMLYRVNMLGMVYRMEKDPAVLKRLNDEMVAVTTF